MKTLAIECASEACSVALFDGDRLIAHDYLTLGRGHAEHLVPMIAALPEKGQADRIVVSRGPGSFTGVRIGIATARALGIAWGAKVESYPTLALVAATARHAHPDSAISVAMRAGHGEAFVQNFDVEGLPISEPLSLKPIEAAKACIGELIAGTMSEEISAMNTGTKAMTTLPDARHLPTMPAEIFSSDLSPAYCRGPDAKLPGK
ncbi:MAG TPA: tRNA (adenosine(37)-N6)-threonylcarbamoyltransferase complex dimerization subunit type 1 TsaB [Erythrobacter sp.]|nr:tRNA (adenosine(37)-N6)-threonylcarbamoyltransferase complex dimerization subunit type 1 TsaB [Erythrobacter sp.]